jgi:flavin reductase (DIM6/NTAB) family NADH-FMN oxidoreductase RutF
MFTFVGDRVEPMPELPMQNLPLTCPPSVDAASFREAMAALPAGVTIVTTRDEDGTPRGFTASSVTSLSLDPPLVLVCVAKTASIHPVLANGRPFAVNVLACGQEKLADRFGGRGADRFAGGEFRLDRPGPPLLDGAVCQIRCEPHACIDGGDHSIVVGRVVWTATPGGDPLVYAARAFHRLSR